MEMSEKPNLKHLQVVHGPHRLSLSGVTRGYVVNDQLAGIITAGDSEIAGEVVDVPIQIIQLEEPRT